MKITLDTNCLFDVEERRQGFENIVKLNELHIHGKIELRIPAISASEKKMNDTRTTQFDQFTNYLSDIGLEKTELLFPFLIWDITFWGKSVWASEEMVDLEKSIHNVLFSNIPYSPYNPDEVEIESKAYKKWRNSRCDSIVLWSHIHYAGDIFITSDQNFHKQSKKEKLIEMGIGSIIKPQDINFEEHLKV